MKMIILLLNACSLLTIGLLCAVSAQPIDQPGLGQTRNADSRSNKAVNAVASQIREQAGVSATTQLIPVSYASQLVSGATNLFVKIRLGPSRGAKVIHVKLMTMGDKWNLVSLKKDVKESDRLEYFD